MRTRGIEAIVMGGSAGALDALAEILPLLPARLPAAVALVLHVPPERPSQLPGLLRALCGLEVKEAEDKEPIAPGMLYVAPPNYHLLVEKRRCFSLSADEPVHYSRPAIDPLFESAADAYGSALAGVLLSGANEDGAAGIRAIAQRGGVTLVQAPESASAPTMPAAALRLGRAERVLPPAALGQALAQLAQAPTTRGSGA